MLYFVIILCIIVLLVAALLYIPFYFDVEYIKNALEDKKSVKIRVLGKTFIIIPKQWRRKKKKAKKQKKNSDLLDDTKNKLDFTLKKFLVIRSDIVDILNYLSRKLVNIRELEFRLNFGFDDAPTTGIMTGVFNAVVYNFLGFLHENMTIKKWSVDINPDFDKKRMDIGVKCIVRLRIVYIIVVGIKLLKLLNKLKKSDKK